MSMPRCCPIFLVVVPAITAAQAPVVAGGVTSQGRPVARAEVGLVDGVPRTLTNDAGQYRLPDVPPGRHMLFVRAIGYRPVTRPIVVAGDSGARLDVELMPEALPLPEVTVDARWAKPGRLAHTTKYDDFYRRRRSGLGSFLTREDIAGATALRTFELLRGLPGIKVTWNPPGVPGTEVRFARCPTFPPKISVWIDGRKQTYFVRDAGTSAVMPGGGREGPLSTQVQRKTEAYRQWLELFDAVRPGEIEAIEIFRGVAQIPAEFLDDNCAAVVIWTRDGGRAAP